MTNRIALVKIADIKVNKRLRGVDPAAVTALAESMNRLGQLQPISVCYSNSNTVLVAGLHRLEAAKRLEWENIEAVFVTGDKIDLELQEIAENLHRAELTVQERSDQIARWVELIEQRKKIVSAQVGQKPSGRPESGDSKASRDLDIPRQTIQRAKKIASIEPAAKVAAKEAGLDDNQSALLQLAEVPAEEQVEWVDTAKLRAEADDLERKARVQHQIAEDFAASTGQLQPIESKRTAKISEKKFQVAARGTETRKFAAWIIARSKPGDIAKVANWLEFLKAAEVIAVIREMQR
jgi:ParB-like chromosome segregation protein Spo0J